MRAEQRQEIAQSADAELIDRLRTTMSENREVSPLEACAAPISCQREDTLRLYPFLYQPLSEFRASSGQHRLAPLCSEFPWGQVAQSAVGTFHIVVPARCFDFRAGVIQ